MNDAFHVSRNDVPPVLLRAFPGYTGKKFEVRRKERVSLSGAYWDGGSRSEYRAVHLDTGEVSAADSKLQNPLTPGYKVPTIDIPPRVCIVKHSIFCGKDMGLTFYVNPSDAVSMLPPSVELTEAEQICLYFTLTRKSSYNGRNRQQMSGLPLSAWEQAKANLIARGLLSKSGAATVNGKNARASIDPSIQRKYH